MNFKNKINSLFPLGAEVSLMISISLVLFTLGSALYYGALDFSNPFWILCCFFSLHLLTQGLVSHFERHSNLEVKKSVVFGLLQVVTGVLLVGVAFSLENRGFEAVLWTVLAVWFFELGVRNIGHSVWLVRQQRRKQMEEFKEREARKKLELEMAARWAAAEAGRKRKALMEDELMADLESFLGSPDPTN